ncbi:MAG: leukotoxin LktA family filamentous adhesin [Phascolarctobacterium sp.]|nr:leukotoxin LktA family filamentous adhesin [Phascolarctobacterium sp.]
MSKQLKKLRKSIEASRKEAKTTHASLKDKLLRSVVAIGAFVLPWAVSQDVEAAGEIVRSDTTDNLMQNGTAEILAERASGTVGLNRFEKFNVQAGEIANLYFKTSDGANLNTLINAVQNQISVAGTVNAIRNNQIGGNLFFLSPKGMVITASGAINAGSLTVMTPTEDFFKKAVYEVTKSEETKTGDDGKETNVNVYTASTLNLFKKPDEVDKNDYEENLDKFLEYQGASIAAGKIMAVEDSSKAAKAVDIALNGAGSIAVHGQINAQTAMKLMAASIDVSKEKGSTVAPILRTGVVFNNVVNTEGAFESASIDESTTMTLEADSKGNLILTDASNASDADELTGDGSITLAASTSQLNYQDEESSGVKKFAAWFGNGVDTSKVTITDSVAKALGLDRKDDLVVLLREELGEKYDEKNITYQDIWACYTSIAKDTVKAEVNVGEGAIIKAPGNVSITASASLEQTPPKAPAADASDEEKLKADINLSQQMANTIAKINVAGKVIGNAIEVNAEAESTYSADGGNGLGNLLFNNKKMIGLKNMLPEKLGDAITESSLASSVKDLANELNVALGLVSAKADVTVANTGKLTTVKPTSQYNSVAGFSGDELADAKAGDISVSANSTADVKIAMNLVPKATAVEDAEKKDEGKTSEDTGDTDGQGDASQDEANDKAGQNGYTWMNGGMIWEQIDSNASVNIQGTLDSSGDVELKAEAANSAKANLSITPLSVSKKNDAGEETKQYTSTPAYINVALGLINQNTNANVTIGSAPQNGETAAAELVKAAGAVDIFADSNINLDSTVGVKSDDTQAVSTSINIINSNNKSQVDNYAQITGNGVEISATETFGTVGKNVQNQVDHTLDKGIVINTSNAIEGVQQEKAADGEKAPSKEKAEESGDSDPAGDAIETDVTKTQTEKVKGLLDSVADKNKDAAGDEVEGQNQAQDTNDNPASSKSWNQYYDLGAAVTVANISGNTNVNLAKNSVISSYDGDVKVDASVTVLDNQVKTTNVFINTSGDTKLGVNAAVTVDNFNNNAKVIVAEGAQILASGTVTEKDENDKDVTRQADININAKVDNDYKRLSIMVGKVTSGWDHITEGISTLTTGETWSKVVNDAVATAQSQGKSESEIEELINKFADLEENFTTLAALIEAEKEKFSKAIEKGKEIKLEKIVAIGKDTDAAEAKLQKLTNDFNTLANGVANVYNGYTSIKTGITELKDVNNYMNILTSVSTVSKGKEATAMVNGTVAIQNSTNIATVDIAKSAIVKAQTVTGEGESATTSYGNVNLTAESLGGNVNFAGMWKGILPDANTNSGSEVGLGGTVAVQNTTTESNVLVHSGAEIAAKELSVEANNKVTNAVGSLGGANSSTFGLTGMVAYAGGSGTANVSVDEHANITAEKITLDAKNNDNLTVIAGDLSSSNSAVGASVGVISFHANTFAKVLDLDNTGAEAITWDVQDLDLNATTSGVLNNLTIAGVTATEKSNDEAKSDTDASAEKNGAIVKVKAADGSDKKVDINDIQIDGEGRKDEKSDPPSQAKGGDAAANEGGNGALNDADTDNNQRKDSSVRLAIAGSVSYNSITNKTEAELGNVKLNLADPNNAVNVLAEDSSYVGAYSGAMARTKAGSSNSDVSFSATLAGAVAVNDLTKNTSATIKGTEIAGGQLTNKAVNSGAQVAAGVGLGINTGATEQSKGFDITAAGSVNLINSTINAEINNASIKNASVSNVAYDKDLQIAGGVTADYAKSNASIGASVTVQKVTNNVKASIANASNITADSLTNLAASKLTQVGTAISLGLATGDSSYVAANGAVVVNNVNNNINSEISGSTITVKTADIKAEDGKLTADETENTYIEEVKSIEDQDGKTAFDVEGKEAISNLGNDTALETDSEGAPVSATTTEDGETKNNGTKYNTTSYDTDHSGNTIVGSAVTVTVQTGKGAGGAAAGSVVYNNVDNDFAAKVKGSTINVTGNDDTSALNIEAKSDTLVVGTAVGVSAKTNSESSGLAAAGSVVISRIDNDTYASIEALKGNDTVTDSVVKADKVNITADTKTKTVSVAGEAGVSLANAALGMTWAQNSFANTTGAYVLGAKIDGYNKALELTLDAENTTKNYAVAAAANAGVDTTGSKALNVAATGAFAGNNGTNDTEAVIDRSAVDIDDVHNASIGFGEIDDDGNVTTYKVSKLDVKAKDDSTLKAVAGTVSVAAGGNLSISVGGSVVNNNVGSEDKRQRVFAQINNAEILTTADAAVKASAENNAKLFSLALGGAVAASGSVGIQAGVQGSVAVDNIYTLTNASMTDVNINKDSNNDKEDDKAGILSITAKSDTSVITSADGLSVSATAGGLPLGALATVSKVTSDADTLAYVSGGEHNVNTETISASSTNKITDVAIGINVAATSGSLSGELTGNVAVNTIANDTIAKITKANIYAGSVGVLATSEETLRNYGGALGVSASSGTGVSGGATVVVNKITGNTQALVEESTIDADGNDTTGINSNKGLVVNADAKHKLVDISITGGVGAAGMAGIAANATVGVNTIKGETVARISDSDINKNLAAVTNANVLVKAKDYLDVSSHIGTLSVGVGGSAGVGVGASVDNNEFDRKTVAEIVGTETARENKQSLAGNDITVDADSDIVVTLSESGVSAGASGTGAAAITGVVSVDTFIGKTEARIKNVDSTVNDKLSINADSAKDIKTYTNSITLSGGIGSGSISAAVSVVKENSETIAELVNSDVIGLASKDNKGADVELKAHNKNSIKQEVSGDALAISIGGSIGATVGVNNFNNKVKTNIEGSNLGTNNEKIGTLTSYAQNEIEDNFQNITATGGLGAVGVGVGVNTVDTSVINNVTSGLVNAQSVSLKAEDTRTIKQTAVGATVGAGAIATNVMINNVGTAIQDVVDDSNSEYRFNAKTIVDNVNESLAQADKNTQILSEGTFTKDVVTVSSATTMGLGGEAGSGVKTDISGAVIKATDDINVNAKTTTNTDLDNVQAALAIADISVAVASTEVKENTGVNISGGALNANQINIESENAGTLKQRATHGNAAGVSVNVIVSKIENTGDNKITISNGAIISAGKELANASEADSVLNIIAKDNMVIDNYTTGVETLGITIGALFTRSYDYANTGVEISGGSTIENVNVVKESKTYTTESKRVTEVNGKEISTADDSSKTYEYTTSKSVLGDVNINAINSNKVKAETFIVQAGLANGNGAISEAVEGKEDGSKSTSINIIGENTFKGADIEIEALNQATTYAKVNTYAGSLLSVTRAKATASNYGKATTSLGDGQTFIADNVDLNAIAKAIGSFDTEKQKFNITTHSAEAIVVGGTGGAVAGIGVNTAEAIVANTAELTVGHNTYQNLKWVDLDESTEQTDGTINKVKVTTEHEELVNNASALELDAHVVGTEHAETSVVTVGAVIGSGSNYANTTNNSKTILNFNPGDYVSETLSLEAYNADYSVNKADGNGGSAIDISPFAASVDHKSNISTTINVSGNITTTGDIDIDVSTYSDSEMQADALRAKIAGGSGVSNTNTVNNTATVNINSAKINEAAMFLLAP